MWNDSMNRAPCEAYHFATYKRPKWPHMKNVRLLVSNFPNPFWRPVDGFWLFCFAVLFHFFCFVLEIRQSNNTNSLAMAHIRMQYNIFKSSTIHGWMHDLANCCTAHQPMPIAVFIFISIFDFFFYCLSCWNEK